MQYKSASLGSVEACCLGLPWSAITARAMMMKRVSALLMSFMSVSFGYAALDREARRIIGKRG
jgi:hypothetical protein